MSPYEDPDTGAALLEHVIAEEIEPIIAFRSPIITRRGVHMGRVEAGGVLAALEVNAAEWVGLEAQRARLIRELQRAIAEYDTYWSEAPCDAPQHLPSGGNGGRPQSPALSRQSTPTSPTKASTPSGGFPMADGRKARSSRPASGGSRGQSTLRPASLSATNAVAPRSTVAPQIPGEHGRG